LDIDTWALDKAVLSLLSICILDDLPQAVKVLLVLFYNTEEFKE
jgi:hypothetical protein